MNKSVIIGCALSIVLSSLAFANVETSPWSVSLNPGAAVPVGKTADVYRAGPYGEAGLEYHYSDILSFGLMTGISQHKIKPADASVDLDGDGIPDPVHLDLSSRTDIFHAVPVVKVGKTLGDTFHFKPYVMFGIGYFHTWNTNGTLAFSGTTSTGINLATAVGSPAVDGSFDDWLGMLGGLGIDLPVADHWLIGASVEYEQLFQPNGNAKFVMPTATLKYVF